ncbi:CatB-related O-acetyltransferase [Gracilibacillus dipsosauri]|uniref:CatB-related O-acetyltransferase n=1 Tax=Gracilibacillus dipsosauri TaxID=178340 RepID=UPI0015E86F64|nr:CatB-related O-acetyltransferase [Gracilibacillus dipsosauri]
MNFKYLFAKVIKKIQLPAIKDSNIDTTSRVCSASQIVNSKLGKYSYIGNYCRLNSVVVGKFCSIADGCVIGGASHPMEWVSTSPVFHNGKNILRKNFSTHSFQTNKETIIENDVWIGSNCLIKSGVKIQNGAVVGMGSIVTKDIGPYEIWAGNPAKLIRKRFDDEKIKHLLQINWWDWEEEMLTKNAKYFNNVNKLLKVKEELK